jgi:hypothetical protein
MTPRKGNDVARPRKSIEAARLSGALQVNPGRYLTRNEPLIGDPLGPPPKWLKPAEAAQWVDLDDRLPWLNKSHRGIVGLAAILQAKLEADTLCNSGIGLLMRVLNQLCATPTAAGKVS